MITDDDDDDDEIMLSSTRLLQPAQHIFCRYHKFGQLVLKLIGQLK